LRRFFYVFRQLKNEEEKAMSSFADVISTIDGLVWGPFMLILLVGTGIFLTVKLKFRTWRNLGYALHSVMSRKPVRRKEARAMYPRSPH
jgi:AGCS family alanine or glycine:cation symporter